MSRCLVSPEAIRQLEEGRGGLIAWGRGKNQVGVVASKQPHRGKGRSGNQQQGSEGPHPMACALG